MATSLLYLGAAVSGAGLAHAARYWRRSEVVVENNSETAIFEDAVFLTRDGEVEVAVNNDMKTYVSTRNSTLFIEGVLIGFGEKETPDLEAAMRDARLMYGELVLAYESYHQHTEEGVIACLGHLSNSLRNLQAVLQDLHLGESELLSVIDIFRSAQRIVKIGEAIIVGEKEIQEELMDSVKAWQAGDYKQSGIYIGYILAKFMC
eukprot:CAMPEP_0196657122 /NCGR_PEP_ID=MMETSP1086-20130531/21930_1 /TAXON_ID=77921 /ORGANISM="Cyanoptyche  gloeocystis , Strain SAG4.97" /LENGTH=204 /DNA_ID=CAMNT_0041990147 /DNA_START=52 /DNA_END=666 /DNA_ORIENTATION=+